MWIACNNRLENNVDCLFQQSGKTMWIAYTNRVENIVDLMYQQSGNDVDLS